MTTIAANGLNATGLDDRGALQSCRSRRRRTIRHFGGPLRTSHDRRRLQSRAHPDRRRQRRPRRLHHARCQCRRPARRRHRRRQLRLRQLRGDCDPGLRRRAGKHAGEGDPNADRRRPTSCLVASYNAENLDPNDGAARFNDDRQRDLQQVQVAGHHRACRRSRTTTAPTNSVHHVGEPTLQMLVDAINAHRARWRGIRLRRQSVHRRRHQRRRARRQHPHRLHLPHRPGRPGRRLAAHDRQRTARRSATPAGNTDQQTNPDNPFFASRPPLVATFEFNGEDVTIVNNHFTSKGGSGALYRLDQPPLNAGEVQRAAPGAGGQQFRRLPAGSATPTPR